MSKKPYSRYGVTGFHKPISTHILNLFHLSTRCSIVKRLFQSSNTQDQIDHKLEMSQLYTSPFHPVAHGNVVTHQLAPPPQTQSPSHVVHPPASNPSLQPTASRGLVPRTPSPTHEPSYRVRRHPLLPTSPTQESIHTPRLLAPTLPYSSFPPQKIVIVYHTPFLPPSYSSRTHITSPLSPLSSPLHITPITSHHSHTSNTHHHHHHSSLKRKQVKPNPIQNATEMLHLSPDKKRASLVYDSDNDNDTHTHTDA
jgi:hypothetical protein